MPVDDGPVVRRCSLAALVAGAATRLLAPDGIGRMLADAELSLKLESRSANDWYLEACKLRGIALYFSGRPAEAIEPLRVEEDDVTLHGCGDRGSAGLPVADRR